MKHFTTAGQVPTGATPPARADVEIRADVELDPGYNTLWLETSSSGEAPELLRRHVLYVEDAVVVPGTEGES